MRPLRPRRGAPYGFSFAPSSGAPPSGGVSLGPSSFDSADPEVDSSNTAPHFGHFAAAAGTSAPQFVHMKPVSVSASVVIPRRWRSSRARVVHQKSIRRMKYREIGRISAKTP